MALAWPPQAVITNPNPFRKGGSSRSGGPSLNGGVQVVTSPSGRWLASVTASVRGGIDGVLAWRAFYAGLDGMAGEALVPVNARGRARDHLGRSIGVAPAASIGGDWFLDHTGLGQAEPEIMWTAARASAGAVKMTVVHPEVPALRPGMFFGFGERAYLVSYVVVLDFRRRIGSPVEYVTHLGQTVTKDGEPVTVDGGGYRFTGENLIEVGFWPRLRTTVEVDTPLVLGQTVCLMRPASDDAITAEPRPGDGHIVTAEFEEVL